MNRKRYHAEFFMSENRKMFQHTDPFFPGKLKNSSGPSLWGITWRTDSNFTACLFYKHTIKYSMLKQLYYLFHKQYITYHYTSFQVPVIVKQDCYFVRKQSYEVGTIYSQLKWAEKNNPNICYRGQTYPLPFSSL